LDISASVVRAQPVRAVIAEDEGTLRDELREALAALWPELEVCAVADDGVQALRQLELHSPDVLFLDIQMPGMSGLDVAKRASGRSHVVFVTAYDKYAVAAFEHGAVDYVMKPIDAARLADAVKRLKARVDSTPAKLEGLLKVLAERLGSGREYARWITASQGDELRLITMEEICYFRADNKCTMVVTAEKESLIYRSIKELAEVLDPATFWQIHRGTIINIKHISAISRDYRGRLRVKMKNRPEILKVSAPHAHLFRQI
jgi:DNA-binding LytR/AlgR family response regulator